MGINHQGPIVTDGLVFHVDAANIKSYPGTGTTWYDLSGNGNNGTLVNGTAFSSQNMGNMSIDGIDDYIDFGDIPILNYNSSIGQSFSFWIKIPTQGLYYDTILNLKNASVSINWTRTLFRWQGSNYETGGPPNLTFDFNTWFNVAITYKNVSPYVSFYKNAVLTGNSTLQPSSGSGLSFTIGAATSGLNYNISNTQVYNRVLSATEIQQNFNATRGRYGI